MAFEYDGKVYLNLEEQVEVNSRMAVDAKETAEAAEALVDSKADKTYVDTELAKKVTKQTTTSTAKKAYVYDNTGDTNVVISANADSNTLVMRTAAGRIVCNDPGAAGQAATKGYVDNGFIAKSASTGIVYTNNPSGEPSTIAYTNAATGSTVVTRTSGGQVKCVAPVDGEPFHNDAAINRAYADGRYTKKQTTTSTAKRAYAYDNTGDINVVISADNANGGTIVQRTSAGRIVCNDPNAAGQAATKRYVDDLISSAVVDFNGSNIDTPTTEVGLKVYAAMQTFGYFVPAHTGDGTIFARPLTDSEVTIPANTFAFSAIQATSSRLTDSYSSGLYYTVDSAGVITAQV